MDSFLVLTKRENELFSPGNMSELQFWLLVEISPFHSDKIINALKDFLVTGYSREEIYRRHKISSGYFSKALSRFQRVSVVVSRLVPFYGKGDANLN